MLAELAIANAAFAVIKKTLANGKELIDAGEAVGDYFKAEKDIAIRAEKRDGDVLEAFQAKEQLKRQEEELKWMLNKQRLRGYHDFLQFKAQYSRDLKEVAKEKAKEGARRNRAIEENLTHALKAFGILFVIMAAAVGVAVYWKDWP